MHILPSRSRPHNLRRLVNAWVLTGASTPVELCLDDDDPCLPEYTAMPLPSGWRIVVGAQSGLSQLYNKAYERNRNAPWFSFIADDIVPRTDAWDVKLIAAAGPDGMAVPSGGHDPNGTPHFVLGGDLARSMGWLALPGLDRLYIDTVWAKIAGSRGVLRHCPDVVLEHRHFSNGKALMDGTYRKRRKRQDKLIYDNWRQAWLPTLKS